MKLVIIPPYKNPVAQPGLILAEIISKMEKRGQLNGIEVDIDEGYFLDTTTQARDEEVLANVNVGNISKVREYCESDKHDAIVLTGGCIDPALVATRAFSKIPVTGGLHSSLHVAS
ncbi:hypothetical protein ACFLWO_00340, partial [Chloroflexota bacterium]